MKWHFLSTKVFLLLVLGILPLLLVTGCGSSGDSSAITVKTGSLSKAEFIKKADAVCRAGQQQAGNQFAAYVSQTKVNVSKGLSNAAAKAIVSGIVAPILHQEAIKIGGLGAPDADKEEVVSIVEAIDSDLEQAQSDPSKALTHTFLPEASRLAKSYGMLSCPYIWT